MGGFDIGINAGKIFFIGIGGVSMSTLAEILHAKGYGVAGSDERESKYTLHLKSIGIPVTIGHSAENITDGIAAAVRTAAVKDDNPEITRAFERGVKVIDRAELLGRIIGNYGTSIGVSGTHGKTTTTSMIIEILLEYDPTVSLGGFYQKIGGNFRMGASPLFIFEACEYCDSFLKFHPSCGLILNIDLDHLDYFRDISHIRESFRKYAENVRDVLVINAEIDRICDITRNLPCRTVTFRQTASAGEAFAQDADYYPENIEFDGDGFSSFDIVKRGEFLARITTRLTGEHNIGNCLAAFAACHTLIESGAFGALPLDGAAARIARALEGFIPADRRFQKKGVYNGAAIVDDYAHHPTEIKAALSGAKKMNRGRVICLFQPHTYTRTLSLFDDFAEAFADADEVAFVDIYAAREADPKTVNSETLARAAGKTGKKTLYFKSFEDAAGHYAKALSGGDLFITMGAGDVYKIGEAILSLSDSE